MLEYPPRGDYERRICLYFRNPAERTDLDALKRDDDSAAREIAELQAHIEELQQYRRDMAARAAYLVTAEPTISASLTRHRDRRTNKVLYAFAERATYPDGTSREISCTTYPGTDRAKALAFVRQYQRDTGRAVDVNIKRPDWDR